jgi:hypothetical protein
MKINVSLILCTALLFSACVTAPEKRAASPDAPTNAIVSPVQQLTLDPQTQDRILALDPENVTADQVRDLLSKAPAPRIINIHGGVLPIQGYLVSFSQFLTGMGYPESSIRNPRNGLYTFAFYDSSEMLAGTIAWYYEHEGMRPMLVGHSQGGFQVVRVLYRLIGDPSTELKVWNPLTDTQEERSVIIDPLTNTTRPVVGLQVSFASATVAGGLARILPNQWSMNSRLRHIPDSVEEFTGFQKGLDLLGGDYLGYGSANDYESAGSAVVRNVRLPASYAHTFIPDTKHLAMNQTTRNWIENYRPTNPQVQAPVLDADCSHILWAADLWYSVKKHWVLELQRLIRSRRALNHAA